ncbi:uncharacterized protein LOC114527009 [Dendronephthya gigantea]|uniref:uncharacterized protein LOC114527009 n=1 Tax=Dendronephthya gigantea TaxID=151771 RepID=UPI001069E080|nr:uncharacterized protein LOC114527009 [Dendronephthya gigantea]
MDDVIHIRFSVEKISKDKKYKDQKKNEILNAICALLNSNGGTVEIRGEETEGNLVSTTILHSFTRTLEQSLQCRLGAHKTESVVIIDDKNQKMIAIRVSKARFLVTMKYNLYRPTQRQVELFGNDNLQHVVKILNRKFVDQPVQLDSHEKIFSKNENCSFRENEVIQFKLLKSVSSKRVTLADRMIGKSNKFSCYVSAFANHRGGHIYYGIDDDGIVYGEDTENISEIEKKVEKAIQKMIWFDVIGQPKRGEHWEIFFQPVLDEKSNPIPSTFVIVIFIAPCFGGVFAEEPESYEMVEGKVERMSFTTWKEKLPPVGLNKRKLEVPSTIKRISLSPAAKKRCCEIHEVLTEAINNARWEYFASCARHHEQKYPNNLEVHLVVLSRRVTASYRQGNIHTASILLAKFEECLPRADEPLVFKLLFQSLRAAFARASRKSAESRDILIKALTLAENIEPGLCTAAPYLILSSIYDSSQNDAELSPEILCMKALQHLEYVEDAPMTRADLYHLAHITLAAYHLGYNLSGKMIKKDIDKESLRKAQASIMAVYRSVCEGNPLTTYREIWLTLAQSMLYIRHSQLQPEKDTKFLNTAISFAKKAENLANDSGLVEIVHLAKNLSQQLSLDESEFKI